MHTPRHWDIFCRVVDNFGDAGVCWRLARRLGVELGASVRLWIDDLHALRKLQPDIADAREQNVDGIVVLKWNEDDADFRVDDIDVVVEAFGCGLPQPYIDAFARSPKRKVWIVLEYLSAEPWVREHHALPSPHPRLALERWFYFPGFVEGTGGLLREGDLFERRDAFDASRREGFWRSIGQHAPAPGAVVVSIFAYPAAPLAALLQHWARSPRETVVLIPDGPLAGEALRGLADPSDAAARVLQQGALELRIVPWIRQVRYDELLWACDVNFVRGEDSFVRAQWAARPLVWHIYPQQDAAHATKLEAFLDLYCDGLDAGAAAALRALTGAWNGLSTGPSGPGRAWDAFMQERNALDAHAVSWASRISAPGELAENLASFCADKLK